MEDAIATKWELSHKTGVSVLPSSTNAVSIEDSIILSEPGGNRAFNEYMRKEYQRLGITTRFIDTSNYAHQGFGNLHCATHYSNLSTKRKITIRLEKYYNKQEE